VPVSSGWYPALHQVTHMCRSGRILVVPHNQRRHDTSPRACWPTSRRQRSNQHTPLLTACRRCVCLCHVLLLRRDAVLRGSAHILDYNLSSYRRECGSELGRSPPLWSHVRCTGLFVMPERRLCFWQLRLACMQGRAYVLSVCGHLSTVQYHYV
jgi:hypothetical protein